MDQSQSISKSKKHSMDQSQSKVMSQEQSQSTSKSKERSMDQSSRPQQQSMDQVNINDLPREMIGDRGGLKVLDLGSGHVRH